MRATSLLLLLTTTCSLTPIPDVSSNWQDPCDDSVRLCEVEFRLKVGNEHSVELRGDFRDGGWDRGEALTRDVDGGLWSTRVRVSFGAPVQYKFLVDGSKWQTDPANPRVVADGKGNQNSLLDNVTCASWTCAALAR